MTYEVIFRPGKTAEDAMPKAKRPRVAEADRRRNRPSKSRRHPERSRQAMLDPAAPGGTIGR